MHTEQRIHALDAVRAFALLAGIVLHGTMSFLPDLISTGFPIADRSPSMTLEVGFYAIHIFRMSAFFLIAGFFAHLMFHRKGMKEFVRDRLRRIGIPFAFGWLLFVPMTIGIIVAAVYINNDYSFPPPPPGQQAPGFPLIHLWFLYYLLMFYVVALLFREAIVRTIDKSGALRGFVDKVMRVLVNGYVAPIVFAVPTVIALYAFREWQWPGIPTPETGITPKLPTFVAYGSAFVFGWLLHRQTELLATFQRRWVLHLAIAVIAGVTAWHAGVRVADADHELESALGREVPDADGRDVRAAAGQLSLHGPQHVRRSDSQRPTLSGGHHNRDTGTEPCVTKSSRH
jgi:glucans biosynthesis protein C